ncbi:acetoin reductase family protein [Neolentinus lepideus HHB14362 ss-1]|uniref:Acetoin reductase family protein n=1 Tax=Neolentinus lepideus HHB14362 ss-1 TaxID=1314782 RepID=A0A165SXF4_9AGAM|nr:acetoin reductase family protein [Neolentinus lepideus HHB14362 ss-1]
MAAPNRRKVAIITGAAQGIGRGIAKRLADDGFTLALNDVASSRDALVSLREEVTADSGVEVILVEGDVSREEDVKTLVDAAVREFGGLDAMIANAGVAVNKPILETSADEWDRLMNINARGTFFCYKHAAAQMVKQGKGGRIVGACSIAGKTGMRDTAAYCASKFAIRGLTQSAALEWGKYGITVNAYAPGPIDTAFLASFDAYHTSRSGAPKGSWVEAQKSTTATGTLGTPHDVAGLVSYLVSDAARFVNGQNIIIDGGGVFD